MAKAVVNLVFLGLMFVAVMVCVLGPVAAIGCVLWSWRAGASGSDKPRNAV